MDRSVMAPTGRKIRTAVVIVFMALAGKSFAQSGLTTVGIQFKPIVPSKFFSSSDETVTEDQVSAQFSPRFGYNFGMVIRQGLSKMWSLESGISTVQRNYRLILNHPDLPAPQHLDFRFIGYEIPIQGLVYVRLGEQLWMNAAAGVSVDLYPSNVESSTYSQRDSIYYDSYQKTWRRGWIQFGVLANYGFEYRTRKSGYFYFGASYHRPFREIAETHITFTENQQITRLLHPLNGNYLTVDLRYFFHEDP